jgi:hypothetical protein
MTIKKIKYIQQLIRENPHDIDKILKPPEHQDESVWKYEHLRQFCLELNLITVRLQNECVPSTCNQMTATEQWIFLCAAHKNPKEVKYSLLISHFSFIYFNCVKSHAKRSFSTFSFLFLISNYY